MKVVVLAGGRGTRLGLDGIPKGMVPIEGIPALERILRSALSYGFSDFLFLTGYLGDVIEDYFGNGRRLGASIEYVREEETLGTAGSFNPVRDRLTNPFMVIYGDVLMDVDLTAFANFALKKGGAGSLFAHPNDHPFDSDLLEVDGTNRILAVHPKPHVGSVHQPNLVSAALYVLFPSSLDYVDREGASDWGRDVFPRLATGASLHAYRSVEYIKDIGTPDRLARAEDHLRKGRLERLALRTLKPALFLDRDGVINEEVGGAHSSQDVSLIAGAAKAIRSFNDAGIPVICVTNQPDLAKGKMSWQDLLQVTGEIDHQLANEAGSYVDDLFVCPHHPEIGWTGEVAELKTECDCRKPRDGMLRQAGARHHLDLENSWLIGDRYCDIAAGKSAGARTILVRTGHDGDDRERFSIEPDKICTDICEAAAHILEQMQ